MKNATVQILFIAALCIQLSTTAVRAQISEIKLLKKTVIGGEGSWDYITVDTKNRRLYVSHSNQVEVLDADSHKKIGVIPNTKGVHGIVVIPELGRGITTNGKSNTATIFDLKTLQSIAEVKTGEKPDAAFYDNFSKRVFIFNNDGGSVTVVDPATGKIVGTLELGGAPEAGVSDEEGLVFVNLEDKNELVVFEAKTLTIKSRWSLAPGEEPTGLAIDRDNHRLFSVCHNELMIILNSDTGELIAKVPIGKKVDGVVFNAASRLAISSNGEGSMTIVKEVSPMSFQAIETIKTQPGAKTIAFDPKTQHVFVSAADYGDTPTATTENPKPKPNIIPGTFAILEYGKK